MNDEGSNSVPVVEDQKVVDENKEEEVKEEKEVENEVKEDKEKEKEAEPEPKPQQQKYTGDKKICIVTGANTGIGKETAKGMMQKGYYVIFACRSMQRGSEAEKDVLALLNVKDEEISRVMELELSDFDSIKEFATQFKENFSHLHVLLLNAGLTTQTKKRAKTTKTTKTEIEQKEEESKGKTLVYVHWDTRRNTYKLVVNQEDETAVLSYRERKEEWENTKKKKIEKWERQLEPQELKLWLSKWGSIEKAKKYHREMRYSMGAQEFDRYYSSIKTKDNNKQKGEEKEEKGEEEKEKLFGASVSSCAALTKWSNFRQTLHTNNKNE